jgi:hypothetical protein
MQREFLAKLCFIDENKLHKVFLYKIWIHRPNYIFSIYIS